MVKLGLGNPHSHGLESGMPHSAQAIESKRAADRDAKARTTKLAPKRFDPVKDWGVKRRGWLFLFCGVILPAVAMLFETTFHFCARHFFDPFPSAGHVVLFGLIPFSNFLVWIGTRRDLSNHFAFMSLISGMAMGVACLYTLMFLPLTPMACLFSLVLGFGLLGLAPMLSLPCNWISGKTVRRLAACKNTYFDAHQLEHVGHMIILVMVIAIELPSTLTRINLSQAVKADASVSRSSVAWLRRFGSQEVLLRACYERSGRATDILGSLYESTHPLSVDQARRVFFKVTGKPFNSVPIPRSARATIQHTGVVIDPNSPNAGVTDEFDIDTDIAGEAVSTVARGLSVSQSKLDAKIDGDSALASLNWAFSFTNDSKFDREARAKILLPPNAVVTKATLTVNNIEHDATIMLRSAARDNYRRAVTEHKAPLLVSTSGIDQLLVQCYPVGPNETMTVKLQIAAPCDIDSKGYAVLVIPAFLERNFQVTVPVQIDIQSTKPFICRGMISDPGPPENFSKTIHYVGKIDPTPNDGVVPTIAVERDSKCNQVWCKSDKFPGGANIVRDLSQARYIGVKHLIVVVDGSGGMRQYMPQIAHGLMALPSRMTAKLKVIGDSVFDICPDWKKGGDVDYIAAAESLSKYNAEGGQENFPALSAALAVASQTTETSVLWIHAAQPITSGTSYDIKTFLEHAAGHPLLFDMQLVTGPNEILNGTMAQESLVRVARSGLVNNDLIGLFTACVQESKVAAEVDGTAVADGLVPKVAAAPDQSLPTGPLSSASIPVNGYRLLLSPNQNYKPAGVEGDERLAKIWANAQICRALEKGKSNEEIGVSLLADSFKIVSPVSSAVVTEPVTGERPRPPVESLAKQPLSIESLDPRPAWRQGLMAILMSTGCIQAVGPVMSSSSDRVARYSSTNERFKGMEPYDQASPGGGINSQPPETAGGAIGLGATDEAISSTSSVATGSDWDRRALASKNPTFGSEALQLSQDAWLLSLVLLMSPLLIMRHTWLLPVLAILLVGSVKFAKDRIDAKARARRIDVQKQNQNSRS